MVEFSGKPLSCVVECPFAFATIVPQRVVVGEMVLVCVHDDACPVRASEVNRDV